MQVAQDRDRDQAVEAQAVSVRMRVASRRSFAPRCAVLCVLAVLFATPAPARAGIRLAASACPGESGASSKARLNCDPSQDTMVQIFGTFDLDAPADSVVALDGTIDIVLEDSKELAPFWHLESGGCNANALAVFAARPKTGCAGESTLLCGARGGSCLGGISAVLAHPEDQPNRVRMLFTLARRSDAPVKIPALPSRHFVMELDLVMDRAAECTGCDAHATVEWTTLSLYSTSSKAAQGKPIARLTSKDPRSQARIDLNGSQKTGYMPSIDSRGGWARLQALYH
jgi:hypothetical protein